MAKKHYCKECQNLIDEGKEIKFSEDSYRSSRYSYSSSRRSYITYYLCPKCVQKKQEEISARQAEIWKQVGLGLLILVIILIVGVVIFLFYQHSQDKKLDRITKKSQKK